MHCAALGTAITHLALALSTTRRSHIYECDHSGELIIGEGALVARLSPQEFAPAYIFFSSAAKQTACKVTTNSLANEQRHHENNTKAARSAARRTQMSAAALA